MAINGEDVETAGRDYVISLLQNCHGKISICVKHLGEGVSQRADSTANDDIHYTTHHSGKPAIHYTL